MIWDLRKSIGLAVTNIARVTYTEIVWEDYAPIPGEPGHVGVGQRHFGSDLAPRPAGSAQLRHPGLVRHHPRAPADAALLAGVFQVHALAQPTRSCLAMVARMDSTASRKIPQLSRYCPVYDF